MTVIGSRSQTTVRALPRCSRHTEASDVLS